MSSGSEVRESAGALATAMSTVFLAQQLPPLSKFDGSAGPGGDKETIKEWLEQFELVAGVCRWDAQTKLVNLVTHLRGEAYSFFKSCSATQRNSYSEMAAALTERFTPVRIQAVQTSHFHDRKHGERESVDSYAQALRGLFQKAYPTGQRGSPEAESMGKAVLASQFVAGLVPGIKAKVAGSEGDIEALLAKARFEEAKLRDLAGGRQQVKKPPLTVTTPLHQSEKSGSGSGRQGSATGGQRPPMSTVQCFGCGAYGHYRSKCPARGRGLPAEAPGKDPRGKGDRGSVAALAPTEPNTSAGQRQEEKDGVSAVVDQVAATMHSITSEDAQHSSTLGPIPMAEVQLEGEPVKALLDTGSPVTIVSLKFLLQVWAKQRPPNQTVPEWKAQVESKLEPTPVALRNYGGGRLPVVRQALLTISRPGHVVKTVIQVQRDAPAQLLIGTDLLSKLGFLFVRMEANHGG